MWSFEDKFIASKYFYLWRIITSLVISYIFLLLSIRAKCCTQGKKWPSKSCLNNDFWLVDNIGKSFFTSIKLDSGVETADSDPEFILTDNYLEEANDFIQGKCTQTAVSFIYLPKPPRCPGDHPRYLANLEALTRGLPPSILIHGVSPVISTTL